LNGFAIRKTVQLHEVDCRFERPTADEDRQSNKPALLVLRKQRIAPLDCGAERVMAGRAGPISGHKQIQDLVQSLRDLVNGERPHAYRGELNRQRYAVQPAADLDDGILVLR
jgi:hypothetical protein